jgi:hypothetical protein
VTVCRMAVEHPVDGRYHPRLFTSHAGFLPHNSPVMQSAQGKQWRAIWATAATKALDGAFRGLVVVSVGCQRSRSVESRLMPRLFGGEQRWGLYAARCSRQE